MKIAIVGQGLNGVGGVPTVARWLADQIEASPDLDYDCVDLATSASDPHSRRALAPRTWRRKTLRAEPADGSCASRWGANVAELEVSRYMPRRELTDHLRRFDLIQVVAGGPAVGRACLEAGKPVVLQVATLASWERMKPPGMVRRVAGLVNKPVVAALEERALLGAAAVLVENGALKAHIRSLGQTNVVLAPPGVDCARFTPPAIPCRSGPLLSICRLEDERKGLHRMVKAYEILLSQTRAAVPNLLLAGAGPAPASLRQVIQSAGLSSRVSIREDVTPAGLPALYREAACFLQTSYEEGLGISSIEAMASGIPVVASENAGSAEVVVDGKTGRLVRDDENFESNFAAAIEEVLLWPNDQLHHSARSRAVETFSNEAAFAAFRNIYRALA